VTIQNRLLRYRASQSHSESHTQALFLFYLPFCLNLLTFVNLFFDD
jgi:hypothetical protein